MAPPPSQNNIIRVVTPIPGKPDRVRWVYNAFKVLGVWYVFYTPNYNRTRIFSSLGEARTLMDAMTAQGVPGEKISVLPSDGVTPVTSYTLIRLTLTDPINIHDWTFPSEEAHITDTVSGGAGSVFGISDEPEDAPHIDVTPSNPNFHIGDRITTDASEAENHIAHITYL